MVRIEISYRWIARDVGLRKNTVAAIVGRSQVLLPTFKQRVSRFPFRGRASAVAAQEWASECRAIQRCQLQPCTLLRDGFVHLAPEGVGIGYERQQRSGTSNDPIVR